LAKDKIYFIINKLSGLFKKLYIINLKYLAPAGVGTCFYGPVTGTEKNVNKGLTSMNLQK